MQASAHACEHTHTHTHTQAHINTHSLSNTHIPDLPTPKYFCPYSEQPMSIFSDFLLYFFADAPPISQNKTVSKVNFSTIHLVRTVCELTSSIIQRHYTWTTLFCFHLRKSFLIENHRTLSPKTKHHLCCFRWCRHVLSWTVVVWSEFVSLVLCILPPLRRFRVFFRLFIGFMQLLISDSSELKHAMEDG